MALDPQVQRYLERIAALAPTPLEELTPEAARAQAEAEAPALFGPKEDVANVVDEEMAGVPVRSYLSAGAADFPAFVYFHGGGWVQGSLETHDGLCRALANRVPCRVVAVHYRLAPEHRFPAAVEDAWAVTQSLAGGGGPVAVGGDSAGGNLAAVVALRARDARLPLAFQVLIYPVTDHDLDTPSYLAKATGFGLTREGMRWFWNHYLGDADGANPAASPLRAGDFEGLAPALVVVCEHDVLRDEGVAYAERLRDRGVQVQLSEYRGMIHGFARMPALIDRARDLHNEVAAALRQAFNRG